MSNEVVKQQCTTGNMYAVCVCVCVCVCEWVSVCVFVCEILKRQFDRRFVCSRIYTCIHTHTHTCIHTHTHTYTHTHTAYILPVVHCCFTTSLLILTTLLPHYSYFTTLLPPYSYFTTLLLYYYFTTTLPALQHRARVQRQLFIRVCVSGNAVVK